MKAVDALELLDRLRMVVDAQVDGDVARAAVAAVLADDEERGRLPPAPVAAGRLGGGEAGEQPLGERPPRRALEGRRQRVHGGRRDEDVPLRRVARPGRPAGPLEALGARVGRRAPMRVDDAELAVLAPLVGADERPHDVLRRVALAQEREPVGPVGEVRPGLRRDRADLGLGGRHGGAHGEELRLDGDAPLARLEVAGDDRVRRDHARDSATAGTGAKIRAGNGNDP